MKLSAIYTNKENIFPTIRFRPDLNVVFARVKDPTIKEKDSHNLGKTFLAEVIDYCLLTKIEKDDHPFKARSDLFGEFIFFIELKTNRGQYVTVRRKVTGQNSVSIYIGNESGSNLNNLPDSEWTLAGLGLDKAQNELNDLLDLEALRPYDYRKGLRQFLRRQEDYLDEFRTSRFARGKDKDWKPYIARTLGFEPEPINQKYQLDDNIEENLKYRKRLETESGSSSEKYDEIKGLIEIQESGNKRIREDLERFSFREIEAEINEDVIKRIESQIAKINQERYTLKYELEEIDKTLSNEIPFDVKRMFDVFGEIEIVMPDSLKRDYEQLVDFHRRLTADRNKHLRDTRSKFMNRLDEIAKEIIVLDDERSKSLAILQQKESLTKYRELQRHLLQQEERVLVLKQQLSQLDQVSGVSRQIEDLQQTRGQVISSISKIVLGENETYSSIRRLFSEYVRRILNVPALLSVQINQQGNLEFRTRILDQLIRERETNESQGTSYKKLLCACIDLSILGTYSTKSFYRFVYHDGIFEGLDNRKKVGLLDLIREACASKGIQYILTVIDSDLPRDERDQKLMFAESEIVRLLHDDGDDGRLFRMSKF